jgi:hypothetical protein
MLIEHLFQRLGAGNRHISLHRPCQTFKFKWYGNHADTA